MFVLVLRLVVIITVVVVAAVVAAAAATQLIFAFLCTPKNRQTGAFTLFDILEAKNTGILRPGSPTPRYVRCCFASGSKNHGIYSVFVPVPSKNTGIPSFHHVARCSFYVRKGQPYCILRSFGFPNATKNRQKIVQKRSQIDFQKQLIISASLFPHHHTARHRRI